MFQPLLANISKVVDEIFSVPDDMVMKRTLPSEFWEWRVGIVFDYKSTAIFGDPFDVCPGIWYAIAGGVTGDVIAGGVTEHCIESNVTEYAVAGEVT